MNVLDREKNQTYLYTVYYVYYVYYLSKEIQRDFKCDEDENVPMKDGWHCRKKTNEKPGVFSF